MLAKLKLGFYLSLALVLSLGAKAQAQTRGYEKFAQMQDEWPTPNTYRTASGMPGYAYWQQKADYDMKIRLDDEKQRVYGEQTITYHNNSPEALEYLWLQLDQNLFAKDNEAEKIRTSSLKEEMALSELERLRPNFDGGFKLDAVTDTKGNPLSYTVNKTMMRLNLDKPLKSKDKISFRIKWWYNINDGITTRARCGYEFFPQDKNYAYYIAQFYPRMAAYTEFEGWQNKQYYGRGEFALSFGDYQVEITVPEDHIVGSTGVLQNPNQVLTKAQRERLEQAKTAADPVMIVTEAEAKETEKTQAKGEKTWIFKAENVRDFAFTSSRKFIWDAQGVKQSDGSTVMAMSYYPKEGNPLWERYSTRAVAHTLRVYSRYTFDYPYPVAISVHANFTGMEYPMICFNYGRPRPDGSYPEQIKYGMISVIIHEVGHNYFPMIVNSDERQWSWMDEGLNSFLQYLTEVEWERDYPSRRGPAPNIVNYMKGDKEGLEPIMTNSESIIQFGNNAYGKPATALNILRETIMGRELFDHAFKTYSNRWKFKHPTPADFFRTMEDASAVDLDWFWRGWFYSIDHVDISLDAVKWYRLNTHDTDKEMAWQKAQDQSLPPYITRMRNDTAVKQTVMELKPELKDKYNERDPYRITEADRKKDENYRQTAGAEERAQLDKGEQFYELQFSNIGGLVMPIILEFRYEDGSAETHYIPAEIWRTNAQKVSKVFVTNKPIKEVILDPYQETADTDRENNYFPRRHQPSRFELYLQGR